MSSNLARRIAFAVVAIPVLVGIIYLGGWVLAGAIALVGVLGAYELYEFARRQRIEALRAWGYSAAIAIPLWGYWATQSPVPSPTLPMLVAAFWLLGMLLTAVRRGPQAKPLSSVAITLFAPCYAAALPAFLIAIRVGGEAVGGAIWAGVGLTLFPLVLTWVCDTLAMVGGHAIGGAKLSPALSPKKTWAGAISGFAGAVILALVLGRFALELVEVHLELLELVAVGAVVGIIGQMGDIAQSLFKREVGVKDSSNIIPGHGGILDRLDSVYFVVPSSAALFTLFGAI